MESLDIAGVRRLLEHDREGHATRALIRCLRVATLPVSQALAESLSREDQDLRERLLDDAKQAERALQSTWQRLHPGQVLDDEDAG